MIQTLKYFAHNNVLSYQYRVQYRVLGLISLFKRQPLNKPKNYLRLLPYVLKELQSAFWIDASRFASGDYPIELQSDLLSVDRLSTFKDILEDYPKVLDRRKNKKYKVNSDYPDYFSRTFHFQTDGYTSEESAFLYDEQVETLFVGAANLMRRALISSMSKIFSLEESFSVYELACGTGTSSKMVTQTYKNAKIKSTDLSKEYIKHAKKFNYADNITYDVDDATKTKEKNEYDCVFQVFLMHELPLKERVMALEEQIRLVKSGGYGFILDSVQLGDKEKIDQALKDFPTIYHEPYFKSYISFSLEKWIKERDDIELLNIESLFFSKCLTFRKK